MAKFLIYDRETGAIDLVVSGLLVDARANAEARHGILEGEAHPRLHRVNPATLEIEARSLPPPLSRDWREERLASYPPLSDLADALYWQARGDETKWRVWLAACDAVKSRFPKEESR